MSDVFVCADMPNEIDLTEGTRRNFPMPPQLLHATHQGARNIELTFSDGATGILNAEALL
jgi:hypothetical protein